MFLTNPLVKCHNKLFRWTSRSVFVYACRRRETDRLAPVAGGEQVQVSSDTHQNTDGKETPKRRRRIRRYRRASSNIAIPMPEKLRLQALYQTVHVPDVPGHVGNEAEKRCSDSDSDDDHQGYDQSENDTPDTEILASDSENDIQMTGNNGGQNPCGHGSDKRCESSALNDKVETESNGGESDILIPDYQDLEDPPRGSTVRDLIRSQERLLEMLQTMKLDISRMDREASRIKEDVVRSNQLFDIVVKMKAPHHLPVAREGFNVSYAMPRVTYQRHLPPSDAQLPVQHLQKLSTYRRESYMYTNMSPRSSVSSDFATACQARAIERRSIRESLMNNRRLRTMTESSNGNYSGTESDLESVTISVPDTASDRSWQNTSRDTDTTLEGDGSGMESASTCSTPSLLRQRQDGVSRRQSYFYASRLSTPSELASDGIEL